MLPMKIIPAGADAKPWDKLEPLFDDDAWYAERKLDGWRFLLHFGGGLDRIYLTGRNVTKDGTLSERGLHVPLFTPEAAALRKWGYTVLDGEVMPPDGAGFRDINGIMGKTAVEKALARIKAIGHPEYHVFDCLFYNGTDNRSQPQHARKKHADHIVREVWPDEAPVYSTVVQRHGKLAFYEREIADGQEGIILKRSDAPYGEGWLKVKRMHTLDVVITGFTEANEGKTGKFKGLVGAVVVSVYRGGKLVEVGQVSGMDDETRIDITDHTRYYMGKALEIKAQEFAKNRLRHPRWSRMRTDINATACTWEKMQRDLAANKKK